MTDLARPLTATIPDVSRRMISTLALGLLGGFALGVAARAWMRLVAEDPAFTWEGTLFIIVGFTIFGLAQSVAAVARRRCRRRWTLTVARLIGTVGLLPLFIGAGAVMLPTVVAGGLAVTHVEWRRLTRSICLVVAAGPVLFVAHDLLGTFGWSLQSLAGFVGLIVVYAVIVAAARWTFAPPLGGRRLNRWVKVVGFVVLGLLLVHFMVGFVTG